MSNDAHDLYATSGMIAAPAHVDAGALPAGSPARPARAAIPGWIIVLLLAAYVFAESATGLFPNPRFGVQPLSPHPALAIAVIALGGVHLAPALLIAVLVGWEFSHEGGLSLVSVPAAIAMTAVYCAAALALRRWGRWGSAQIRPRDVNVLLAVALPTALLCALVEALRQVVGSELGLGALPLLMFRLFIANLLGMAVLAPLVLQCASGVWLTQFKEAGGGSVLRDGAVFILVLGALLELVFGMHPLDEFRMSYLLFLPMLAVAMRRGVFGVASLLPAVELGLLLALMLIGTRAGTAFEFQLLMLTLAVGALYLGALSDERQRAAASIAAQERALRERGEALADAQRLASTAELAAALAHDLSQPLSAIGTYANASQVLARRGPAEHATLLETLDAITMESARAGQYLRRMRDFFRTGTMREELVSVHELVATTHAHLRDRMVRSRIDWHTSLDAALPPVRVDAVQVGAVLGNLVTNACDALAEHPGPRSIHVRAFLVPDARPVMVRVVVEDSGPGVAPNLRPRLFLPLATSKPHGMGLGLALSRSIAERLGGRLWYDESRPVTAFCLDLRTHV